MAGKVYRVAGMSCERCAEKLTASIFGLAGVEMVDVDVERGTVTVHSHEVLPIDDIRAAVECVGYQVVGGR